MRKMAGLVAGVLALAVGYSAVPPVAHAGQSKPVASVDAFYGDLTQSLSVTVPPFHGIEPAVSLTYRSSGGNGWAGVGWTLGGFSTIERASPGRGAPAYVDSATTTCQTCYQTCYQSCCGAYDKYNTCLYYVNCNPYNCNPYSCNCSTAQADIFLLDGQELVADASLGGTHSTKIQSYRRIQRDATNNRWYVWRKDGTKETYAPVHSVAAGPDGTWGTADDQVWRWGLTEVRDTNNNVVTYSWGCNQFGSSWCYPTQVSYNGTVVTIYWENRTDVERQAIGPGMASVYGRVKTIDVTVSGSRARAYSLAYDPSTATGRSLLKSVQQFGKDALVDSAGTITNAAAASKLPAQTHGWQAGGSGFGFVASITQYPAWNSMTPLDFNGDGCMDYAINTATAGAGWYLYKSNCNGSFTFVGSLTQYYQWHSMTPLDFNGDGCSDYAINTTTAGAGWYLYKSNCNGSFAFVGSITQYYQWHSMTVGDWNGDGNDDYAINTTTDGAGWYVYLSNGNGSFTFKGSLTAYPAWTGMTPLDFDGDGCSDYAINTTTAGAGWYLYRSNCDGTFTFKRSLTPYPAWNSLTVGDWNGDGKADYAINTATAGAGWYLYLSNGDSSFALVGSITPYYQWHSMTVGDFNGDGKSDYAINTTTAGAGWYQYLSKGDGTFTFQSSLTPYPAWSGMTVGDWDGDGKADYAINTTTAGAGWYLYRSAAPHADLLTSITNSLGGVTEVSYAPSTTWPTAHTDPSCVPSPPTVYCPNNPPVTQAVASVTVKDGRGNTATSSYSYSGGVYDRLESRFLGFAYSRETLPCLAGESPCPYEETWFKQDYGSVSKPGRIDRRNGAGRIYSSLVQEFTTNGGTVPYTSNNTGTWAYAYDGSGNTCSAWPCAYAARTYHLRTFDGYGNLLTEKAYGDYDISGDERTTASIFLANTSLYIVGLQAVNRLYEGLGTGGTLLEEALITYDSNTTWNAAPTKGRPAKTQRLASTTPSYQEVTQQYDTYGNVTAEIGPTGAKVAFVYDSTYHLFRTEVRDAVYHGNATTPADTRHKVTMTNDALCGGETQKTEMSGLVVTRLYDPLCRLTRVDDTSGYFETHSYVNIGSAGTQYLQVDTPSADGVSNQWMRDYLDGLGRTYKTMQKGPATGQEILTETTFNARGSVATRSAPYYAGAAVKVVTAAYDVLDRLTKVTNPDGTTETTAYGLGVKTSTDEAGVSRAEYTNALGQVTRRREWLGATALDTVYAYNSRGQATQITDPKGNVYKLTYNALGQKATYVDPDRGTTAYEYDIGGQLTAVIDALGQRVEYLYDVLGRKTKQVEKLAGGAVERTLTFTFDEARAGYANVGGLTTMTDALGTATLNYTLKGHLAQSTRTLDSQPAYTFTHGYDAGGRLKWSTLPDGDTLGTATTPRTYDGAGRPKTIPGYVTGATYTAAGRPLTLTRENGTVTTFAYDANRGWLTDIDTLKGATVIQNLAYTRDAVGRALTVTSPFADESWTYAYNGLGFLTSATGSGVANNQSWDYDAAGNLTRVTRPGGTSVNYTYESAHGATSVRPHAVKTMGTNSYTYNGMGNMLTGAGRTITWYANGLPKTVGNESYAYDGNNARAKRTNGAVVTYFVSSEYEVTGSTVTKYVTFGQEMVAKKVGATKYWLHADGLGSIQAITDANGVEVQRLKHRPYGERLSTSTTHVEARGFTGQRHDDTGLIYLNARYYDPVLGRFISADPTIPSAASVGLNRYAYAGNDPINTVDVNGLGFWKKVKNFFKKVWNGIKNAVKALFATFKAALHGDWKAILTIVIMVAAICIGGMVMQAALKSVVSGAAAAFQAGASALAVVLEQGVFSLAAATYVAVSAGIGAVTGFAIGYVQTGSFSAALKAGINGAIGGALNACINIAMSAWLGVPKSHAEIDAAAQEGADFKYEWGRAGPSGSLDVGIKNQTMGIDLTWDMGQEWSSAIKGYYNQWASQAIAPLHDRWGAINLLEGLKSSKSLIVRDLYAVANMVEAAVWQAVAEGALSGAFGKTGPTTQAVFFPQTAAASFFEIPKNPYPGVSREDLAKAAIKVQW